MDNQSVDSKKKDKPFYKNQYFIPIIGTILGIIGGYIYYIKIGCVSGSCAITSNPWLTMLWGGLMGYLIFDIFNVNRKKTNKPS